MQTMTKTKTSFKKGQSGNPKGKRPGTRNKATLAAQALLDGEAEALTRKAIELAKEGDMQALRLCLDRLLPPRKDRPITLDVPGIEGADGLQDASVALMQAVVAGEITPGEGQSLSAILEGHRKLVEMTDIERRVAALEKK